MAQFAEHIDTIVQQALDALDIPEHPAGLYDPVVYTMQMGGKRMRPRLVLLSCGLCGGEPRSALAPAMAVEMLHNFTLLHDDIMDNAETRRGNKTVHKKWDEATAILSGDVLFVLALKQLNTHSEMMPVFLDAIQEVCNGQALDMQFQTEPSVSISDYSAMISAKTAALLRCSMKLGAMAAGADSHRAELCGQIGHHAGLAFQIQDDLLDAIGDKLTFGKQVGGDIREGKKTWLTIRALEQADDTDRLVLQQVLGDRKAPESEILRVIRLYHDLGIVDEAVQEIERQYNQALVLLEGFEKSDSRDEINRMLGKLKVRDN